MSVSLAASVAVVTVDAPIRLTFTATTGNFVRVWCTAAPTGSKLRGKLDENKSTRVHVQDSDSGREFDYTFDSSGAYQFAAQELTKGAAPYGGGYQGAPDADRAETLIGETALTFYVATAIKATIGQGQDTGDLILYVANDLIKETTIATHGRATPAVEKPRTDKATTAAEGSALATALADLVGTSATTALGSLSTVTTNAIDKFNLHIASGTFHATPDVDNAISASFRSPTCAEALKRSLAALLKALSAHTRNDSVVTPAGTGSAAWHGTVVDWASIPLFESSATVADHVRALADAWRSFEAHRTAAAHLAPDTTNTLTALPKLLNVHRLFLRELASLNPTTPITENSAKTILVHGAGFEEI
jgi:hypothetical protein